MKIISLGLLLNGPESYLRSGWNIIDVSVVIISIVSLGITSTGLKFVKIFRLMRVLRPLRVISRDKGLRLGVQALFRSVPNIMNVILILVLFFLIFGIIGVNYLKGQFYSCTFQPNQLQPDLTTIITKWDCLNLGGTWINFD